MSVGFHGRKEHENPNLQPENRLKKPTHREPAFYGVFFYALGEEGDLLQCIARAQEGTTTKHLQGVFPFLLFLFFFLDDGNEWAEKMHYGKTGVTGTMEEGMKVHG
jgi:hypothetical protein